jgi:hypothetical protein
MTHEPTRSARDPASARSGPTVAPSAEHQPSSLAMTVALTGAAFAWTAHLLAGYVIVAAWCSARWRGGALAIGVLTALCAVASAATGLLALRIYRRAQEGLRVDEEAGDPEPWDARMGERGARAVFLGVVAMFMAAIFTLAIVLQGLPVFFAPFCPAWTMP